MNIETNDKQLRLLQLVADIEGYAILLLDTNGDVESWNRGAKQIKGYSADEIIGRNFSVFYTEVDRKNGLPAQLLTEATAHNSVYNEAWRIRKNGTTFWGAVTIMATYDEHDQLNGFAKITRDLTERMLLESNTRQQARELEIKNQEIEQFVYIASHDLQEPLLTVTNFIEFFKEEYSPVLDKNAMDYLCYITKATERMKNLIRNLLDYSRLGIHREKILCNCEEIVRGVLADLHSQIKLADAVVLMQPLPLIEGYATELAQLFQNLISNAIKFSRPGIAPEVEISAVKDKTGCTFYVADNGIGIDPKFSDKIFLIFQRLNDRNKFDGNGIGLAHCKKIVDLHGGQISFLPNVNGGSVFKFNIPTN